MLEKFNIKEQNPEIIKRDMCKWLRAPKYGTFIKNTHIIPFKCPLAHQHDSLFTKEQRFNWEDIYAYTELEGRPIKYVIDLTLTDAYYIPDDLPTNVIYYKYKIPSKKFPTDEQINEIFQILEKARIENATVGVHCANGKNRTGLITIWYMIKHLMFKPNDAIKCFGLARGLNIDYEKYLSLLLSIDNIESLKIKVQEEASKDIVANNNNRANIHILN